MALPVPVVKRGDEAGLSVMAPAAIGRAAGSRGLLTMACFGRLLSIQIIRIRSADRTLHGIEYTEPED